MGASPPSETYFAFFEEEPFHLIMGLPILLPTRADQLEFDIELGDVEVFISDFTAGMGVVAEDAIEEPKLIPAAEGVGDVSAGLTMVVGEEDAILAMRVDIVAFRRGKIGAFIMVAYIEGDSPLVSVVDLANLLDARIVEEFPQDVVAASATDLGGQEIRIAVENAYPPFCYIDPESGEALGWDYEVGRAICEKLNCVPVFVEATWAGLFEAVAAGEYDVSFNGIIYSPERSQVVQFGEPYFVFGQVILIRADDARPQLADEESLVASNLNIGALLGSLDEDTAVQLFGEERVIGFEQFAAPIDALIAGEIDSVIFDEISAIFFMLENPGRLKISFTVNRDQFLAPIYTPTSDLVASFNWAMEELFLEGTMDEICERWFFRPCAP
ncbi:MAG: transporter substrate-binding domain-containing protein [Anaerolineales bacterium]|nr:transporter substrate-binding domain-containing protein [Anaerolineales bacterium]